MRHSTITDNSTMENFWDGKLICRICLKVLGTSGYTYVCEENIKEMIMYSVPELDIYASADPAICSVCHNMLLNVYNFKKKCINTEVILRTYRTRHHIEEDGQVDLAKLIEELVRFNSYVNQQEFNKSLSLPFPPPDGTVIAQPEITSAGNAVDSNKNKINDENLSSSRCKEFDIPQLIDPNTLTNVSLPQQSASAQMELPQFDESQFDRAVGSSNDDPTVMSPNAPNVPDNISESNKRLLQNFPMHFMASSASNQLGTHLNRHHLVDPNQNHQMNQPPFVAVATNRFVNVNHNQFLNIAHPPQLVNSNQAQVNMPVGFFTANPNNRMQNVMVPLVINPKPANVPLESFRFVPANFLNRPMTPFYSPRDGGHIRPTLNVTELAKNVVVRPPIVSEAPPKPREKVTEQRLVDSMKILKVILKRKLETHPIESKRRLVVELERSKLIPSSSQNENDRSSDSKQKLFQCVGCMYMTTSSKFFAEHMKKCAHAPKENRTKIELKCTKCPYVTFDQTELDEHVMTLHTPHQELFRCKSCNFVTTDKILLERHQTVDRSKCPKCTHMFCSEENLKKHMERHEKNTCPFCTYSPVDRHNLRRHLFAHNPIQIPCEFCDYRHPSPYVLRTHLRKYHNGVGIEDLDYKPNILIEDLIQEIKTLIEATK